MSEPLVTVVTPFYNSAPYLAECIESVLAQSYQRFEYILSDNCSTDGSSEIAEKYSRLDSRIRLIRQSRMLTQVEHYNSALAVISDESQFCKMVQADDAIFPECLKEMAKAFQISESIGLVSAFDLKAGIVRGSGFPYPQSTVSGREIARHYLRTGLPLFGSPTTVMYRSAVVRSTKPFFEESLLHEDTEKCMQILELWDFGFVYQVLSFLRVDDISISAGSRDFQPSALDHYIVVRRYAPKFCEAWESSQLIRKSKRAYYRVLAHKAIKSPDRAFWEYHRNGLKTLDETIDWPYLLLWVMGELLVAITNPGTTIARAFRLLKSKTGQKGEHSQENANRESARCVCKEGHGRSVQSDCGVPAAHKYGNPGGP